MERQTPPTRDNFWDKRYSPLHAVGVVIGGLIAIPVLLGILWIVAIYVSCSANSHCFG